MSERTLIERLRGPIGPLMYVHPDGIACTQEAADEIERLQARNELLERLYEAVNTYKAGRYNWRAPRAKLWMAVEEAIAAIQTGDDQG